MIALMNFLEQCIYGSFNVYLLRYPSSCLKLNSDFRRYVRYPWQAAEIARRRTHWTCYDLSYNKSEVSDPLQHLPIFLCKNVDINGGFKWIGRKITDRWGHQFLMMPCSHRKRFFRHFKRRALACHGNKLNFLLRIVTESFFLQG